MFDFGKKEKLDSVKQLSEEDIQKKLYGAYKPGTLGRVIKASEEDAELQRKNEMKDDGPTLFSEMDTIDIIPPQEGDAPQKTAADTTPVSGHAGKGTGLRQPEPMVPDDNEEELFQLDLHKEDSRSFTIEGDKYASFKLGFQEFLDSVRGFGLKYLFIGCVLFVLIILVFNIISSYLGSEERSVKKEPLVTTETTAPQEKMKRQVRAVTVVPAVSSAPEESNVAVPAAGNEPVATATKARFTIQVCVSNDRDATEKLVGSINDTGLDAFYKKTITRSGKQLYFVYVGRFAARADADAALRKYRAVPVLKKYDDSFVTSIT